AIGIIYASADRKCSASRLSREVVERQPCRVKNQIALNCANTRWKIRHARRSIFDVYSTRDSCPVQSSSERSIHFVRSASIQIRNKSAQQPQIERAVQFQSHRPASSESDISLDFKVGFFSLESHGVDINLFRRRTEMNRPGVLQLHV